MKQRRIGLKIGRQRIVTALVPELTWRTQVAFINTPLQRGVAWLWELKNRFNGFWLAVETVETVRNSPQTPDTPLKQGVNEKRQRWDAWGYARSWLRLCPFVESSGATFTRRVNYLTWSGVLPLLFASCAVGPNYKKPDVKDLTPTDWRWKTGEPRDEVPKGEWWVVFNEPVLNRLETEAVNHNQNLQAVVARVDQSRAAARLTRSEFFPTLSLDPAFSRERTSGHLPTPIPIRIPSTYVNSFSMPLDLSYEVDLWGRVRRSFEAARAQAEASVADYQNTLLTLTADVAVNYFLLRSLEVNTATLRRTVELRSESVVILQARVAAGAIPESDLARAKTELASAKQELADTLRQKAEVIDALALLCGAPASSFEVAEQTGTASPPKVPAGLPSLLLERRPDIAGAERRLVAKNAEIGVARAAYFPVLRLTGQAGYLSAEASDLFEWNNRVWSIGPSISLPLFNGGRTAADVTRAEGEYQEALAVYRQTVLTSFKEVEDSLAQIRFRNDQAAAQTEALDSAKRVAELARVRYQAGATTYLDVVDAERTVLQQEQQEALLQSERFAATVRLIKALGGGWSNKTETTNEHQLTRMSR